MRNWKKTLSALAVSAIAASAYPALAVCPDSLLSRFGSNYVTSQSSDDFSYVITPGVAPGPGTIPNTHLTVDFKGFFWRIGSGNANVNNILTGGDDSGGWLAVANPAVGVDPVVDWMVSYLADAAIAGTWAQNTTQTNGCIAQTGVDCMGILFGDQNGVDSFFAMLTAQENASGFYDFANPAGAIVLAPVPKPRITGSSRVGNDVTINVGAPMAADIDAGKYIGPCGSTTNITGYKVYRRNVPRGNPGPGAGRLRSLWTSTGAAIPIGQNTTVAVDCSESANEDVYLTQTLVTDGGFELDWVSKESMRVECGPQIAEPRPVGRPATPPNDRLPRRNGNR